MPKYPCKKCRKAIPDRGYCEGCKPKADANNRRGRDRYEEQRGTPEERGYGYEWKKIRDAHLKEFPWCARCIEAGISERARVVHHINGNQFINDPGNLLGMCRDCHEREHGRLR